MGNLRALDSRAFWRRVQMHHRASPVRLALLPLMIAIPPWLLSILAVDALALNKLGLSVPGINGLQPAGIWDWLIPATAPFGGYWYRMPWGRVWQPSGYTPPVAIWTSAAFALIAAITVAAIPSEWRRAGGRPIHLVRVGVYSWTPAAVAFTFALAIIAWDQCAQRGTLSIGWRRPWSGVVGPPYSLVQAISDGDQTASCAVLLALQLVGLRFALRDFLRLRSHRNVWLASAFTGSLAALIVALATFGWRWLR